MGAGSQQSSGTGAPGLRCGGRRPRPGRVTGCVTGRRDHGAPWRPRGSTGEKSRRKLAPAVGFEPTTKRLTAAGLWHWLSTNLAQFSPFDSHRVSHHSEPEPITPRNPVPATMAAMMDPVDQTVPRHLKKGASRKRHPHRCCEKAAQYVLRQTENEEMFLVHGTAVVPEIPDLRYGHAWVEDGRGVRLRRHRGPFLRTR